MHIALSPYHLTTREAPAMAALLLGERVVTALPVPLEGPGRDEVRVAFAHCPRYARLLMSWRWAGALFRAGVVSSALGEDDAMADTRRVCADIRADAAWAGLRRFEHARLFDHDQEYLETVSADILKGGPDPGVSVPMAAAIDRFAARHALLVARAGVPKPVAATAARRMGTPGVPRTNVAGASIAQRAETSLAKPVFSVAAPVLLAADGETLLRARELLAPALVPLRAAMTSALAARSPAASPAAAQAVRAAARTYAEAFAKARASDLTGDDAHGERIADGMVSLVCSRLPRDAALISSAAALDRAIGKPRSSPPPAAGEHVMSLVITPMAVQAA